MSSFTNPISLSTPFTRSLAIAALMGATMLVSPLTAARADGTTAATIQLAQAATPAAAPASSAAKGATEAKGDTVEQRITNLHSALKITPDEETNWNGVAQAMRENATEMQKLAADRASQSPENMTAVQDLKGYEKFARAHFEGLKNLISSFDTLYNAMPAAQKKIADEVFQTYGPKHS